MIKFFRKIRKKLLFEGRAKQYLKYAIGEIILVVIGILIALQINNWNDKRKQDTKIETYLNSMLLDLHIDLKTYDKILVNLDNQVKNNSLIFKDKNYKDSSIHSIGLAITTYSGNYKIIDQTYQIIKNSGFINQLGSKNLNYSINNYYINDLQNLNLFIASDLERSLKDDEFWFISADYEINPPISSEQRLNLPFLETEDKRKQALIKKIESNMGRNFLRNSIYRKSLGIFFIESIKNKSKLLIKLINEELKEN